MRDFTITEDFPKDEIELDKRFSNPKARYDYLFQQKLPEGFVCNNGVIENTGTAQGTSIFAPSVSTNFL